MPLSAFGSNWLACLLALRLLVAPLFYSQMHCTEQRIGEPPRAQPSDACVEKVASVAADKLSAATGAFVGSGT